MSREAAPPRRRPERATRRLRPAIGTGHGRAVVAVSLLVAGGAALLVAGPASADVSGTITSPADGTVYTSASASVSPQATVSADLGESYTATLAVADPYAASSTATSNGCSWTYATASSDGLSLKQSMQLSGDPIPLAQPYPDSCAADSGRPAANGTWRLTLSWQSGQDTSTFVVKVPPASPAGVAVTSAQPLHATVTWKPNVELDTHAYAVTDGAGNVVAGPWTAADACSSSSCTETVAVGSGQQSLAVRAYRYSAPSTSSAVTNASDLTADSTAVSVVVAGSAASATPNDAQATATPTAAAPTGTATSGTSSGASHVSASASSARKRSTSTHKSKSHHAAARKPSRTIGTSLSGTAAAHLSAAFAPLAAPEGLASLPPLPILAAASPTPTASEPGEPTDPGTYQRTLGYAPESRPVATLTTVNAPLATVADAIGIAPAELWRFLAVSLVLLLAAGHLRRWARKPLD